MLRRPHLRRPRRLALAAPSALLLAALGCRPGPADAPPSTDPRAEASAPGAAPATAPPPPTTVGARLGDHPFATPIATAPVALRDTPDGQPGGDLSIHAAACGACHTEIYAEWQATTHAAALRDPQYLAELSKPGAPAWLCLNCHTPLADQRPHRLGPATTLLGADAHHLGQPEAVPNPRFDARLTQEAITCATCHVRVDTDGRGTIIGPRGSEAAPHRVRVDPAALHGVCNRCHDPGPVDLTPQFTCWFETDRELQAGPSAGQSCPSCHMPTTERAVAVGGPVRTTRRHVWLGGGPPKTHAGFDTLLARGFAPGFDLSWRHTRVADAHRVELTLHNARSGHALPSGDPERFLRIALRSLDAAGAEQSRAHLDLRQTWDFGDAATGRPARKLSDNRLMPDERRALTLTLPASAADAALHLEVLHVRLTPQTADWARQAQVPPELETLQPGAAAAVANLPRDYPLAAVVAERRLDLTTGAETTTPPAGLIEASRALHAAPAEVLKRRLDH